MADKGKTFSGNDLDYPRIRFQTPGRTFDRLLKERSLSDLKETVRKKLGLGSASVIQFAQRHNGQLVDLEDDDDFDAFCVVANEQRHASIQVVLIQNSAIKETFDAKSSMSPLLPIPANALLGTENANSSAFVPGETAPHQKVVLKNEDGVEVNLETLTTKVTPTPPTPSVIARQKLPATPTRKTAPIRRETPEQRQKRLEEEEQKEKGAKPKASAEERVRREKEEEERKKKEEDAKRGQSIGSFTTMPSKFGQSVRFEVPDLVSMSDPTMPFFNPPLQRTASQGDVGPMQSHRTRSERGEKRSEASKAAAAGVWPQAHASAYDQQHAASQAPNFEPVVPLQMTENRWNRKTFPNNDPDSLEVVYTNVKALLDKLRMEEFHPISYQIIQWANRSEKQKDGRTLTLVTRLVYKKAIDDATWSEMYARLCRMMMEQISPNVQDEGIRNSEGHPISGGQLFRKYLLNRCQEDLERGWFAKEATAAAAATKAVEDQAVKAANETSDGDVALRYSDEYYAAQKARRRGLGLVKFIGELFKFQMLTERIMHECIKKFLGNVQNPEEEDIESLCMLLTTVGALLDNQKARAHLDIYFQRMQELSKNVNPRMQFMLQDLIELRDRKWQARNTVATPTTLAQVQPWPGYYYGAEHQHYMQTYPSWNWAPRQMSPATQHPHQHPPSGPHTSSVPMPPRTHPPPLQSPGILTLSHAAPTPVSHPPPISHAPSDSMSSMSSPPPTPSSALPGTGRLSIHSSAFVSGGSHKNGVLKNEDGIEVNLETLTTKVTPAPPMPSMIATTSAPKPSIPSKSVWSKGPPQTASAPSPRSQSPAPSAQPQTSHSRRPSALGQGVSVKDGVSVPRNNVGAVKQGTAVTFGSIGDDISAPLSTPPATAPPVKSEGVKAPGTVPNTHINGKASVASRPAAGPSISSPSTSTSSASASTSSVPAVPVSATPPPISKFDVRKLFQTPSPQTSNSSTSTETSSSPATRPSPLPSQTSINQTSQHPPPSTQSSYTPFVPNACPQQPHQQQNTALALAVILHILAS